MWAALQSQHPVGLTCKAEAPLCGKGSTQTSGSQGAEYRNLDHYRVHTVPRAFGSRVMRSALFQFVAQVHVIVTRVVAAGSSLITCSVVKSMTSWNPKSMTVRISAAASSCEFLRSCRKLTSTVILKVTTFLFFSSSIMQIS